MCVRLTATVSELPFRRRSNHVSADTGHNRRGRGGYSDPVPAPAGHRQPVRAPAVLACCTIGVVQTSRIDLVARLHVDLMRVTSAVSPLLG